MKIRIYYEDTDAGGIVYHSNYFKYCERARSEAFFKNGISFFGENSGFVVKKIFDAEFIKPAKLGDLLDVTIKVSNHKRASFNILHEVYRDEEKIFQANMQMVYICNKKPTKIPQNILDFLLTY